MVFGQNNRMQNELEYIIPPCEFEVTKSAPDTMSFTENAEVTLRPHNLAKLLLLRMKNPPADYPRTYIRDPYYEFEESLKMLENYVKNYVDKGYIKFGNRIFKEAKSQDFESPLDKE